jgi:hypothetical protein
MTLQVAEKAMSRIYVNRGTLGKIIASAQRGMFNYYSYWVGFRFCHDYAEMSGLPLALPTDLAPTYGKHSVIFKKESFGALPLIFAKKKAEM